MGRLEKYSPRKRNRGNKHRNPLIVIACEGNSNNKTERIYFNNFNTRKCIVRFPKGNNTDPVGIVNDLIEFIKSDIGSEPNDKYYAVFDTDINKGNQNQIDEARKLAEKNNIEIIISNPIFEFWYVLHFGYTTKVYNSSDEVLQDLMKNIGEYKKNKNIFPIIKDKTLDAIKNSKRIEKHYNDIGQAVEKDSCNPYTSVYKVVQELIRRNK